MPHEHAADRSSTPPPGPGPGPGAGPGLGPAIDPGRRRLLAAGAIAAAAGAVGLPPAPRATATAGAAAADDPAPTTQGAGFYRFRVGELECALVGDGGWTGTAEVYGTNATAEERAAACRAAFMEPDDVPGMVHCLLVRHPEGTLLVDVGCGSLFGPGAGRGLDHIARLGVRPADVDHVLITHLHPDHVGGLLGERAAAVLPNATFHVAEAEHAFWAGAPDLPDTEVDAAMKDTMRSVAEGAIGATAGRTNRFVPGDELLPGVSTLALPGHTPGHAGLLVDSGGEQLAYVADLVHNAPIQLPNPGWHVAFDVDPVQAAATRRRTLDRAASDRLRVCGSHLPFPALGHVVRDGSGYRWVPETWRWEP